MSYLQWDDRKRTAGYQGVDYLRLAFVPDAIAPTSAELTVVLLEAFAGTPFTEASFAIVDGRDRPLAFTILAQNGAQRTVLLEIPTPWDAGRYVLRFAGATGMKLDPFFAEAAFTFHIACERGDCRPLPEGAAPSDATEPVVDTLTKDYAGFVRLLSEWVKVQNPHFADLSPASFERVLLDLIAHHGDMTSYYQDRVASEGFIDTATQRHSLRQHAVLVGASLFDGAAAETWLAFDWTEDGFVGAEREIASSRDAGDTSVTFHTTAAVRVLERHSRLTLAAWPVASTAVIPTGTREVLLFGHEQRLEVGQRLAFSSGELGKAGSFSQVVQIVAIRFDSEPGWVAAPGDAPSVTPTDLTRVTFEPALEHDVRPWAAGQAFVLYGNLVRARHGKRHAWQPAATDLVDPHAAMTEMVQGTRLLRAIRLAEGPVVHHRTEDAAGRVGSQPLVRVSYGGEPWQRVEHLHASASYDRHFVAIADEDGSLWLQFGDGTDGRALPLPTPSQELLITYWVGEPTLGNVGAGVLTRFVLPEPSAHRVVNVTPAEGGRDRESKEAARFRLPASLRHGPLERAVTLDDYARAARTVDGVGRAIARNVGGPFNAVLVLVDPEGQVELDDALAQAVYARVDALRMAGRELFVRGPRYVPIEVELAICVEPGHLAHRVRQAVLRALLPGTRQKGFFHPDELSFGQTIELSDVLAVVQRIPGVRSVKAFKFKKLLVVSPNDVEPRITVRGTEVIRMDGSSDRPEQGKLEVRLVDLDESVDKTKFLVAE